MLELVSWPGKPEGCRRPGTLAVACPQGPQPKTADGCQADNEPIRRFSSAWSLPRAPMTDEQNDETPQPDPEAVDGEVVEAELLNDESPTEFELPDDPAEAVIVLMTELMTARSATRNASDNWKRAAAEFENFRKRSTRAQAELIARSSERVLVQLLPVLDSLDAAIGLEAETETESKMLSGMAGTRELLLATLAREGLEPIETVGVVFDPELHEAAQMGEGRGRMVIESEFRRGYLLNGKVLRASLVAVGYEVESTPEQQEADDSQ